METNRADLTVYAKDFPEARLVLEVKSTVTSPVEQDSTVKRLVRYMWGANCHFGVIMTPTLTYVLRDDFTTTGPESIRITDTLPTPKLLSRLPQPVAETITGQQLELLAREWLERLSASYEAALPNDPEVMQAFFPDIVGAVAEGRVVSEVAA
jgi:hypothetical protein